MNDLQKRTWAEINLENLRHNYRAIRATLPDGCRFLGVVKADAYGHGALPVSRLLQAEGADYLAVSCLDEALELRGYRYAAVNKEVKKLKLSSLKVGYNDLMFLAVSLLFVAVSLLVSTLI